MSVWAGNITAGSSEGQGQPSLSAITDIKIMSLYKKSIQHGKKMPAVAFLTLKPIPDTMISLKIEEQVLWIHFRETVPVSSEADPQVP